MSSSGGASPAPATPVPTDPKALEAAIQERQRDLAAAVDELVDRLHPKNVARRTSETLKTRAHEAVYAEDGSLRVERVAAAGAAVAALVALLVWRRLR